MTAGYPNIANMSEDMQCPIPFKCPQCERQVYWRRVDGRWHPMLNKLMEHSCLIYTADEIAGDLLA